MAKGNKGAKGKRAAGNSPDAAWEKHLPLPSDVSRTAAKNLETCANFGLRFTRFVGFPDRWGWQAPAGKKQDRKREVWSGILGCAARAYQRLQGREDGEFGAFLRRRERLLEALRVQMRPRGGGVEVFEARVAWRMAVGLGIEHPLENGCTLHRLYGFPYIPGSCVKGLARGWRLAQMAGALGLEPVGDPEEVSRIRKQKDLTPLDLLEEVVGLPQGGDGLPERFEKTVNNLIQRVPKTRRETVTAVDWNEVWSSPDARLFRRVFGSAGQKGEVRFLDACPAELVLARDGGKEMLPILCLDVVNPHYGDYYQKPERTPPADWLTPVPSNFLAVRKGARFRFALWGEDANVVAVVRGWLEKALDEWGIGAKTAAGYGQLVVVG